MATFCIIAVLHPNTPLLPLPSRVPCFLISVCVYSKQADDAVQVSQLTKAAVNCLPYNEMSADTEFVCFVS